MYFMKKKSNKVEVDSDFIILLAKQVDALKQEIEDLKNAAAG